jgi:hypothetical protein
VEDAAFAGLSHEDQRTVRAWLATLAASTPSAGVRQKETP